MEKDYDISFFFSCRGLFFEKTAIAEKSPKSPYFRCYIMLQKKTPKKIVEKKRSPLEGLK